MNDQEHALEQEQNIHDMIHAFMQEYYDHKDHFFICIGSRPKNRFMQFYTSLTKQNINDFIKLAIEKNKEEELNVYLSLNTFKFIDKKISRQKINLKTPIKALFFDIDEDGVKIKNQIISELGEPSILLQTSPEKFQLIYLLKPSLITVEEFEAVSKRLTKHFKADDTWEVSRIFRAPYFSNAKNGFKVRLLIKDFNRKFDFKKFQTFCDKLSPLEDEKKTKKKKKTISPPKKGTAPSKKQKDPIISSNSYIHYKNSFKGMCEDYKRFLKQSDDDYSTADLKYMVYLNKNQNIHQKNKLIRKLFVYGRGYESLIKCHPNLDEYIEKLMNIIDEK